MSKCTVSGDAPVNLESAPVPNDNKRSDGQYVDHWVMCPSDLLTGFKRPVRYSYTHVGAPGPTNPLRDLTEEEKNVYIEYHYVKYEEYSDPNSAVVGKFWTQKELDKVGKGCGTTTRMPKQIEETYAAEPAYYGSTFCCGCGRYFPVGKQGEFVWEGTDERVGT